MARKDPLAEVKQFLMDASRRYGFIEWEVLPLDRGCEVSVYQGDGRRSCRAIDRRAMEAARQAVCGMRAMIRQAGLNPRGR